MLVQLPSATFKHLEYLFVEWEGDHSVIEGKTVNLVDSATGFVHGAKVKCMLREKNILCHHFNYRLYNISICVFMVLCMSEFVGAQARGVIVLPLR